MRHRDVVGGNRIRVAVIFALLVSACHPARGCVESSFSLPDDNRLPAWFELPAGTDRTELAVQLDYWIGPSGRSATMTLKRLSGGTIDSVVATQRGSEPLFVPPRASSQPHTYPSYEVLTARGRTEVIEHRRPEPLFYICDDPAIRSALGVQ